jgi:hypothetical protein
MKVQHFKIKKYTLLKLHLIKYQAYKICLKNLKPLKTVDCLELNLKHALNLIYLYHFNNKKILFIGFPYNKKLNTLSPLQHFFISKKLWVNGIFSNKNAKIQNLLKQTTTKLTNPFGKKDPNLVVLFNFSKKDQNILNELSLIGCPLIIIGSQTPIYIPNLVYAIPGLFLKKNIKQFCFFLIYSMLKIKKI